MIINWLSDNFIEIFGAVTGILYVVLEIRQNILLWPIGIITSGVYIWVFFTGKFYADMSLQGYYLAISILGWYWWMRGRNGHAGRANERRGEGVNGRREENRNYYLETGDEKKEEEKELKVTRVRLKTALILSAVFTGLYFSLWGLSSTGLPTPRFPSVIHS